MSADTAPVHPGTILAKELKETGISASDLARRLLVPDNRIYHIILGRRSVTADTALRLSKFFNTTPEYWLHLQASYELDVARQTVDEALKDIQPYKPKVVQAEMNLLTT